ncbi:sulfhydrogenase subunit alpha [Rhodovulum iodosum]|uniref:Sulfhydrogenase subunit alpha n=1 Tax=Rhodovulum iodosum TaxID=68291 RepID=A0ABV3XTW3_9RHOB|nr:nickel-dependent hydrogenase large subunit [Rhodovulum robiginosum]RSK32203.1 Ni/Fe hydrogenase subunit alpha [Rhodovulum robiginosum]
MAERTIKVDALARVEGEGAIKLKIGPSGVEAAEFRIFEPPRFFEALLRGRDAADAPDITSRICGICPVAYITSANQAMEAALGVTVTPEIAALRRLLYCGEWIQSHVLHAAMLHAPDFLGLEDAFEIARLRPDLVKTALRLKKLGNELMEVIGGRAVHPVNTRIGGFWRAPDPERIAALIPELEWGIGAARDMTLDFAGFDFPQDEADYTFVSLVHPETYPIELGRIGSNRGLDIGVEAFAEHFAEEQVARSTALHARHGDAPYLVGPLARYANNFARLSDSCRDTAAAAGLGPVERNPFRSILVRMVEVQYACEEALRLARGYVPPDPPAVVAPRRAGTGHGCTEAPRGICHHSYTLDDEGRILSAAIVPPTSQNQKQIEDDLARVAGRFLDLDDAALQWRCEQAIRNHDPCISCATHALRPTIERV